MRPSLLSEPTLARLSRLVEHGVHSDCPGIRRAPPSSGAFCAIDWTRVHTTAHRHAIVRSCTIFLPNTPHWLLALRF